jgi:pimeloyl-ACP methyl ester carboxylesterase
MRRSLTLFTVLAILGMGFYLPGSVRASSTHARGAGNLRPIVLVHGLNADYTTFEKWYKPGGFLCQEGYPKDAKYPGSPYPDYPGKAWDTSWCGYPVNALNTNKEPTNTVLQNALLLYHYVELVRQATGAQQVDLVAHSMGGLISRVYIQNFMPAGAVAHLFMLGTPNRGAKSADQAAYWHLTPLPATQENTTDFVDKTLNVRYATQRRGVAFFAIGGDIPKDRAKCTSVAFDDRPGDLVVPGASTQSVPTDGPTNTGYEDIPYLGMNVVHTSSLTSFCPSADGVETESQDVFDNVMLVLNPVTAAKGTSRFVARQSSPPSDAPTASSVITASQALIAPQQVASLTIPVSSGLSELTAEAFSPPGRLVTLRAPDGTVIRADSPRSGVDYIRTDRSADMLPPGEGFSVTTPMAGTWTLTVRNVEPRAVMTTLMGFTEDPVGLSIAPSLDKDVYSPGEPVTLTVHLSTSAADGSATPAGGSVTAVLHSDDTGAGAQNLSLSPSGVGLYAVTFSAPTAPGDYGLQIRAESNGSQRLEVQTFQVAFAP